MLRINYRLTVTTGENVSILLIFNCRSNIYAFRVDNS
jgi:hypothetical protein